MKYRFDLDSPKAELLPSSLQIHSDKENGYPPRLNIKLPNGTGYLELMPKDMEQLAKSILKTLEEYKSN